MIKFDPLLEQFEDFVNFTCTDKCIWVAYAPGAAGNLLASLINYHYVNTSASFRGISSSGEVIFRASDLSHANKLMKDDQFKIDDKFFGPIKDILSAKNTNYSLLDQFIISAHICKQEELITVLDAFPNCKIIRILSRTQEERDVILKMYHFKNTGVMLSPADLADLNPQQYYTDVSDPRLLDVYFSDLLNQERFEQLYSDIVAHLELPGKLIRYDFIQYWLDQQADEIKPLLEILSKNY